MFVCFFFILGSSADTDEIPPYAKAVFRLGHHCLPKYVLTGIQNKNDQTYDQNVVSGIVIQCTFYQ